MTTRRRRDTTELRACRCGSALIEAPHGHDGPVTCGAPDCAAVTYAFDAYDDHDRSDSTAPNDAEEDRERQTVATPSGESATRRVV
jgi:hypothetical protein